MNLQTKADFTALMHKFLDPLKPCYSAGCARLHLGETGVTYNQTAIALEAFSRPLWALVPFWVGGGSDPEFEKIYRKGLAAGKRLAEGKQIMVIGPKGEINHFKQSSIAPYVGEYSEAGSSEIYILNKRQAYIEE